jgi:hypothetical protein
MFTAILKKRSASGIRASKFEGLDAMALQAQMAAGTTSALALTRYCLQRINRVDHNGPTLRSVIEVNPDALSQARALDAERAAGMSEELIQQEFYCSFEGIQTGAVFGRQMQEAESEGRICGVPWQPEFPVDTWWDIGTGDPTAIWFTQDIGREIHVIDYYENSGAGVGIDTPNKPTSNVMMLEGQLMLVIEMPV